MQRFEDLFNPFQPETGPCRQRYWATVKSVLC